MAVFHEIEVKTFREHAHCDKCGGELESLNAIYASDPPKYPHACKACGTTEYLDGRYPHLITRTVQ